MASKVSVIIPAWGSYVGPALLNAVQSVQRQDVEADLIIVDNASAVPLPELPEVTIVRLPTRRSTGEARNQGLSVARTPLVVFLDADDVMLDGALRALVVGIETRPETSAFVMSIIDGSTGKRHRSPRRIASLLAPASPVFALANTVWSLLPTQGCTIMRVADVLSAGGYGDSDHGEDWVLGASLAFRGLVTFDRQPALLYRVREDSPGRGRTPVELLIANARRVRARVRTDPAVPRWVHALLPMLTTAQWLAVFVARPAVRLARSIGAIRATPTRRA